MGDISSDTQAEFGMMLKAHGDLRKKDPAHELLVLVEIHEDGQGCNFTPEFSHRCVRDSDEWRVRGYARYNKALRDAARGKDYQLLDTNPPCDY